ncbi:MAG: translation initiation factor IF-2, partial [Candidatus Bathyarchaeia archaeon]
VPTSAKTGEGIPDVISVLIGLTQAYLEPKLQVSDGAAKGTVLEVKEELVLGITINTIIFDGTLKRGDTIVLGGKQKPIITKVRAILLPKPLDEIRDPRDRFSDVESVSAAAGIKIVASDLDDALAGSPLYSVPDLSVLDEYVKTVTEDVERVKISTEIDGVVLKTDTLGSLEAIIESLRRHEVPVRLADVGDVSKRDVIEALAVKESNSLYGVVLAFNVKVLPDAELEANSRGIKIFRSNVIYHLLDEYLNWLKSQRDRMRMEEFDRLIKPAKLLFLPGYVFRKDKPAIFGVEIIAGSIKPRIPIITEKGRDLGEISQIQDKGIALSKAEAGMKVAISMQKPIIGRHVKEGETLYVKVPEEHAKILISKMQDLLSEGEVEALTEYLEAIKRKKGI